jgi:hypothetical protein
MWRWKYPIEVDWRQRWLQIMNSSSLATHINKRLIYPSDDLLCLQAILQLSKQSHNTTKQKHYLDIPSLCPTTPTLVISPTDLTKRLRISLARVGSLATRADSLPWIRTSRFVEAPIVYTITDWLYTAWHCLERRSSFRRKLRAWRPEGQRGRPEGGRIIWAA